MVYLLGNMKKSQCFSSSLNLKKNKFWFSFLFHKMSKYSCVTSGHWFFFFLFTGVFNAIVRFYGYNVLFVHAYCRAKLFWGLDWPLPGSQPWGGKVKWRSRNVRVKRWRWGARVDVLKVKWWKWGAEDEVLQTKEPSSVMEDEIFSLFSFYPLLYNLFLWLVFFGLRNSTNISNKTSKSQRLVHCVFSSVTGISSWSQAVVGDGPARWLLWRPRWSFYFLDLFR